MKKINLIEWLWKTDSHEKQSPQRFARYAAMLIMLLSLGVGQMWAEPSWPYASLYEVYMTYSYNGTTGEYTYKSSDSGHGAVALGTLTADFKITSIYMKVYKNENDWGHTGNICHAYLKYNISGGAEQSIEPTSWSSGTWADERHKYEISKTSATTIASYNSGASGNYTFSHYFKADGDDSGSNCNDYSWYISNNSANYSYTYSIAPPAISSFSVSESGYLSGTGAENDPYIIPYNGTLTLTVNGSKVRTDANSTIKYWKNSGSKGTDNVLTVTGITSTTKTSVVVHAQCINNSSSSLVGTESTKTVWYKSEAAYSVTVSSGAHGSVSPSGAQSNIGTLSGLSVSATPSTGYNFDTWTISSGSGSFTSAVTTASNKFKPTAASTITASFNAKTYSITLNDDGAYDGDGSATVTYNGTALAISSHASRAGWNLVGYFAAGTGDQVTDASGNLLPSKSFSDGSSHAITNSSSQWIYDGDLTLYAHWSKEYSVTYNANGGSGTMTDASSPYEAGSDVTVLTNTFTRSGYAFAGWNTANDGSGQDYSNGGTISSIASNVTLYAQWSERDYTVTVNAGSHGSVAIGSVTGHYDTKVTLPTATPSTGYHFDKWTTTSGSVTYTNQTSATSAQVNGLTAAATVRADFAANTYSVVFNANGGTGSMSNEAFTYDAAAMALTSNSFSKSGYTFVGWATTADRANAMNIDYTNGQSVQNLTSTDGGTFNLYAVWAKKYYIGGRFQHDWEDGSSTTNEMTYDASTGYYKLESNKTVNQLSVQWHNTDGNYDADQFFYIHAGLGKSPSNVKPTYVGSSSNGHSMQVKIGYSNAYVLTEKTSSLGSFAEAALLKFSNTDNLSSNVIVWWDPANRKVWYTATESLNTNYFLLGFGSGSWGETEARRFKVATVNATTATVSVSLSAKTYTTNTDDGFKVEKGGTYYGYSNTMTRANCTAGWVFADGQNNCGITADLAGTYTFTLNLSTMAVTATYPTAYQLNYSIGSVAGTSGTISTSPSTASGSYVGSGNSVTLTGPAAKTGYTWKGWYTNAAGTEGKIADESRAITVTMNADKTLYACYEETLHTEPVNVAEYSTGVYGGTVSPTSVQAGIATAPEVTATVANNAWHFRYWSLYKVTQKAGETTGTNPTHINATEDGGNLTATFLPRYALQGSRHDGQTSGMPDFTTDSKWKDRTADFVVNDYTNNVSAGKRQVELVCTRTLEPNTRYKFEIFDRTSGKTMGHGSGSDDIGSNNWAMNEQDRTVYFNTVGRGTYTFTITHLSEDANNYPYVQISAPTSYQLTLGCKYADVDAGLHDGTTGGTVSATATEGGSTATIANGNYIVSGGSIAFTPSPSSGYTFGGWYKDASCTNAYTNGSDNAEIDGDNVLTISSIGANVPVYAKFVETATTVNLANDTHGHVEVSGSTVTSTKTGITTSKTITAVPQDAAWHFLNWTVPDGVTRVSGALTDETITIQTTTSDKTVTANFEPRYELRGSLNNLEDGNEAGMPGWATGAEFSGTVTSLGTADGVNLTCTRTLNPNSNYKFVIHDRELNRNMGYNPMYTDIGSSSLVLDDENLDVVFWTAGRGDYTFNITCISNDDNRYPTVKLNRPASYILNLGWGYSQDGGSTFTNGSVGGNATATATESGTTVAITNGQYVISGGRIDLSAHAEDGYTFLGYYNGDGYNTRFSENANWYNENISAATTAYAKFQANAYAITFDATTNGGTLSGSNQNVIYNNTSIASCPVGVKEGYHFKGWYTASSDGELIIDASGNLQPSITVSETVWTDSSSKWKKLSGATVYAQYEVAQITNIALSPGTVVENNSTVSVTATISPEPTGTTTICWRVLHDDTGNPLDPQPTFTPSAQGNSVSFTSPNESGMYKVEAVLHTGSGCAGTDLDTEVAGFQVAGSHTVTIAYKHSSTTIKASTSVTGRPLAWSDPITAPSIFGYTFDHWTAGDGITLSENGTSDLGDDESDEETIYIKATYNGTLTANYTPKNIVYFKDNLGWTDPEDENAHIYVNLLTDDYWDTNNGSGNENVTNRNLEMSRVPGTTDIFYYEYNDKPTSNYISFTKESMNNYKYFYQAGEAHVVFPSRSLDDLNTNKSTGLGFYAATPMFVPLATQTPVKKNSGRAAYYNDGYWTKYLPGTGYSLDIYQSDGKTRVKIVEFTSADELMPMKVTTDLEGGHTYKFQLKRDGDVYYGNSGTMTYNDHGQNTAWEFNNSPFSMCTIETNAAGNYTFNLSFSPNSGGTSNRLRISVDYPVASGDYRLVYTDDVHTKIHPSAIVPKENNGTAIVSFFVRKDAHPVVRLQQATVDPSTGAITWNEYPTSGTPTNQITGDIASAIDAIGVYNFNLSMNGSGAMTVTSAEDYTGNFYIRTDAANSKWDNYRTDPDHLMTYSEYSITHGGYSHYYTHWVNKDETGRKNVKFCIANDYSPCISDTLARETASGTWANIATFMEEGGDLKRSANVRFMWNSATNEVSRAYIDGSQEDGSQFLLLLSDDSKIKQGGATKTQVTFNDNGNWLYEANVSALPNAKIKLRSTWGEGTTIVQYFKGASDATETLVGGSGDDEYNFRLIYDFKTNRLLASYVPASGTISTNVEINADVMFVREHQGDIAQLTFSGSGAISEIQTAYGVLRFNKWTINNKDKSTHDPLPLPQPSRFERDLFYISFPFRVNLEEVFGFGTYGTHWIIQEYDGAARARDGYWADSKSFWRFIFNRKDVFLEPNKGYLLALDLDELGESSSVWANTDQVELYFPSYGTMPDITKSTVTHELEAHTCNIGPRFAGGDDRRIKDSHWNVMSVPTYINTDDVTFANNTWITAGDGQLGPNFLYTVNWNDNSLTATSGKDYTYKAMHAYIVQYCGYVTWTTSVSPAAAPNRNPDAPKDAEYRLELRQNDVAVDQAFVRLSDDEQVTTGFDFNYDLSKEFNKNKANIYTMVTTQMEDGPSITETAGNTLPMTEQTTIVPVGVIARTTGDYTFAIPEGTNGVGVTLIDNETGIRTPLSALDYTVNLSAGTYNERFTLEISPIHHMPTGIEEVSGERLEVSGARKLMIDGILYIVKDGKMFDARGARVQ